MRHTEFWERMDRHLGPAYARVWADEFVIGDLDHRTPVQALADGVAPKQVWRAVWAVLDLPDAER